MTQSKKFEIILFSLRLKKTPWLTYFEELVAAVKKLSHQTFLENFYKEVVISKKPESKIETQSLFTHYVQIGSLKFVENLNLIKSLNYIQMLVCSCNACI